MGPIFHTEPTSLVLDYKKKKLKLKNDMYLELFTNSVMYIL